MNRLVLSVTVMLATAAADNFEWAQMMFAGSRHQAAGRFAEAREQYTAALAWAERNPSRMAERAAATNNLGTVEDDLGYEAKAERLYRRSIEQWQRTDRPDGALSPLTNLALLHRRRGDFERAEALYNEALELGRKHDVNSVRVLINLGRLAYLQQKYANAHRLYDQAAQNARTDVERSVLLVNRAELLVAEGRLTEALPVVKEALPMVLDRPLEIDARMLLGVINSRMRQHEEAERHLERAVSLSERFYGKYHVVTACAYAEYAGTLRNLGRKKQAADYRRRASEIIAASPGRHTVSVSDLLAGR